MKFNPEAGRPESAPQESADEAKKFEAQAERHSAELNAENEFVKVQLRSLELSDELKAKSSELLEASGKSDFKKVEEIATEIADLNSRIEENAKEIEAAGKLLEEARQAENPFADFSDEEVEGIISEIEPEVDEVQESLNEVFKLLEETIQEKKDEKEKAKADLAGITESEVDAAVEGIKEKDEVEESLAEIRKIHEERQAEQKEAAAKEDDEWMEIDISDLEDEPEGPTEMGDDAIEVRDEDIMETLSDGEDMIDKWFEAGDRGEAKDMERPVGTPDKKEIKDVLEKGELSPERKAALEGEVQRLKNEVFDLVEGIEYTNLDGDSVYKPGLKELEHKLQEMGVDMEKMAISPLERAKAGFMGLFNRKAKKTMDAYRLRLEEFNQASENLQLSKLQLEDPKKYLATMQRRWLRSMQTRMAMKARSQQKPPGGLFTMKF